MQNPVKKKESLRRQVIRLCFVLLGAVSYNMVSDVIAQPDSFAYDKDIDDHCLELPHWKSKDNTRPRGYHLIVDGDILEINDLSEIDKTIKHLTVTTTGTVNVTNSSLLTANGVNNSGTISLDNSAATVGNMVNDSDGMLSLLNGSTLLVDGTIDVISGTIALKDGSKISGPGNLSLGANHLLQISNSGNIIESNILVTDGNAINIEGTNFATDEVMIDGEVTFGDGQPGTFHFTDVNVMFGENAYKNLLSVTASGNAMLNGNGNRATDFIFNSDSVHAPGNSPGTFYANTVTYQDGSTVYINIGNTDYSRVSATNGIHFAETGGKVNIILLNWGDHNATVKANDVFASETDKIYLGGDEINRAAYVIDNNTNTGTVSGQNHGEITVVSAAQGGQDQFQINSILYDDIDSQWLGFDVTGGKPSSPGQSPDTQMPTTTNTIGSVVLFEMGGTDLFNAITGYADGGVNLDKLEASFAQLDPVALSLGGQITQDAIARFNRMNFARLQRYQDANELQFTSGNRYDGITIRGQSRDVGTYDYGTVYGSDSGGLWLEMLGSFANQEDRNGTAGYSSDSIGFGVGLDSRLSRNIVTGLGFSGSFVQAEVKRGMGNITIDNYISSLYGSFTEGGLTINLAGGYAYSRLKTTRVASLIDGYANGTRSANSGYGSLEINYRFGCPKRYFTPFYAMDFIAYREDAYTESGRLINMRVDSLNVNGYLQTVGARLGTRWQHDNGWIFNPELTLGWIHDYGDGYITTAGQFVQGGSSFTVNGTSRNIDRALVSVGLSTIMSPNLTTFARYDGELTEKFNSQTVQAGFNLTF